MAEVDDDGEGGEDPLEAEEMTKKNENERVARVEDIPDKLKDERALRKYFERMFSGEMTRVTPVYDVV